MEPKSENGWTAKDLEDSLANAERKLKQAQDDVSTWESTVKLLRNEIGTLKVRKS
jgi:hypothetical protein